MLDAHLKSIMSKKIKVIELINEIGDGGAETLVKDYALYLNSDLFDITILTEYPLSIKSANVRVLMENNKCILAPWGVSKERVFEKIIRKIRKLLIPIKIQDKYREWYVVHHLLKIQPNVIHVHMQMLKYLPKVSGALKNTKIFYTCHSLPKRYLDPVMCEKEYTAAKFLIENNGLKMIGLHNSMRNELNHLLHVSNSIVVRNCIDVNKFRKIPFSKSEIRKEIEIPQDAFVLGHTGRFCSIKNQTFLIDVFMHISKQVPNAFLLMIGGGDASEVISKIDSYGLTNKYKILSNRSDVNILLHAMDVFIFPSLFEGMPIALIEAQAAGIKCIASSTITNEAIVSVKSMQLNLDLGPQVWAEWILSNNFEGKPQFDVMDYDVKNVMKEIEQLYTR